MVEWIKENVVPFIANIDHAHKMYESLLKLFTINNIGMTKGETIATFFVKISISCLFSFGFMYSFNL